MVVVFSDVFWLEFVILDPVSFTVVIGKSRIDWACMEIEFNKLIDPHKVKMARIRRVLTLNIIIDNSL